MTGAASTPVNTATPDADTGADTSAAIGVDAAHVAEICRLATASVPYATRLSTHAIKYRADPDGVTIALVTLGTKGAVERALRLHGYQLTDTKTAGMAVRATGWSPIGLARRVGILIRAVADLDRAFPATIAQAVRAYVRLHDDLNPTVALYGMADALRADLHAQIARRTGPLPRRGPSSHGRPEPARHHLAAINDLTHQVTELLALHWQAAVRAAGRYSELAHRHPPATAQAKAITEVTTTIERQRQTALFLDARAWAGTHPHAVSDPADGPADTAARAGEFARWYIAEFAPPTGTYMPFEHAIRRWHDLGRPTSRTRTTNSTTNSTTASTTVTEPAVFTTDTPQGGTP